MAIHLSSNRGRAFLRCGHSQQQQRQRWHWRGCISLIQIPWLGCRPQKWSVVRFFGWRRWNSTAFYFRARVFSVCASRILTFIDCNLFSGWLTACRQPAWAGIIWQLIVNQSARPTASRECGPFSSNSNEKLELRSKVSKEIPVLTASPPFRN